MIKKILLTKEGECFYVRDINADFHSRHGFVPKKDLKSKKAIVETNKKKIMALANPFFADLFRKISRHAQIISLKDIGLIIANTGINRNSVVVDLGSGSGALSCFLAAIAKKVTTYDIDDRSITTTKQNISYLNLKNIAVKKKDCYEKIDEKNIDVITADLPEPWRALENARNCLKPGGFFVSYSPQITQSQRLVNEAKEHFVMIKTVELFEREWLLDENRARPDFHGLSHTGFLTFLRKFD